MSNLNVNLDVKQVLRTYEDKEITLILTDKAYVSGTLKNMFNDWLIMSNYCSSKHYVKIDRIVSFYSGNDKPEEKYLPAMCEVRKE